jgi:hypothetical protein
MVDDRPEENAPPDPGRARREPPTIDLDATEISGTTKAAEGTTKAAGESEPPQPQATEPEQPAAAADVPPPPPPAARRTSPWIIAPLSGAVAAALVIGVGWMLGWPPVQAPAEVSASTVNDLATRVGGLESKVSKPVFDPATTARIDGLEKTLGTLHGEVATLRTQSDKLAAAINDVKSAVPSEASGTVDLAPLNARIAELDRAIRTQSGEIAQQGEKIAAAKSADDLPLRRVVAASLLDVAVRHGDSFTQLLNAAKSLSENPDALKPLDEFAANGVPAPPALSRQLLALVPKLQPTAQDTTATTGTGIIDRLQAGAAKLVRIERTDAVGNDRSAVVARATAAALRNDLGEARRELLSLTPDERAAAQGWLDKVAARDAALAASRQFADDSMAALAKPQ